MPDGGQPFVTTSDIEDRFGFHKATRTTGPIHDQVRGNFIGLASALHRILPDGQAKLEAFNKLQEAAMWANFAVAQMAPVQPPQSIVGPLEE